MSFGGGGALVPLFWISGDISSVFQSQSGLPYLHFRGKCNVRSLRSTSCATLCQPLDSKHCGVPTSSYLAQGYYCVVAVSLEPAIIRS